MAGNIQEIFWMIDAGTKKALFVNQAYESTSQEITALRQAEEDTTQNLVLAQSAWAEAEALRKATLALTQDLHMDYVVDALVRSLAELIPYTCARVLVPEGRTNA